MVMPGVIVILPLKNKNESIFNSFHSDITAVIRFCTVQSVRYRFWTPSEAEQKSNPVPNNHIAEITEIAIIILNVLIEPYIFKAYN